MFTHFPFCTLCLQHAEKPVRQTHFLRDASLARKLHNAPQDCLLPMLAEKLSRVSSTSQPHMEVLHTHIHPSKHALLQSYGARSIAAALFVHHVRLSLSDVIYESSDQFEPRTPYTFEEDSLRGL